MNSRGLQSILELTESSSRTHVFVLCTVRLREFGWRREPEEFLVSTSHLMSGGFRGGVGGRIIEAVRRSRGYQIPNS